MLLNGRLLGVQADGTIDHEAALREFAQVECRAIISIEALKGAEAIRRFGPAAREGAYFIRALPTDSSRRLATKQDGAKP
jgi:hypothetical protein